MNRRERRRGRTMYLLPLMLALTGLALLPLEWVLRINDFDSFLNLRQMVLQALPAVLYPLVLWGLYLFRVSPKTAKTFSLVSVGLTLAQLIVILLCARKPAAGLAAWIPGHALLRSVSALRGETTAQNVLLVCSDAAMLLTPFSAIFSCLRYAAVKKQSDARNADFEQRARAEGLYVPEEPKPRRRAAAQPVEEWQSDWEPEAAPVQTEPELLDEPTRVLPDCSALTEQQTEEKAEEAALPQEDQTLLAAIDRLIE